MVIVGIKELNKSIEPWVLSMDAKEPEDGKAVLFGEHCVRLVLGRLKNTV